MASFWLRLWTQRSTLSEASLEQRRPSNNRWFCTAEQTDSD